MIRIYWPGKAVDTDVEKITFSGQSNGVPTAAHGGFGVMILRKSGWKVLGLCGSFVKIDGAGMWVTIDGQRGGVDYYPLRCAIVKYFTR